MSSRTNGGHFGHESERDEREQGREGDISCEWGGLVALGGHTVLGHGEGQVDGGG